MLTAGLLIQVYGCSAQRARLFLPHLQAATRLAEVDEDRQRLACFLGQVGHESGRLRYTREIWGPTRQQLRYEPGTPLAKQLGNFRGGDGHRYLGRGLIQVTGRLNYAATSAHLRQQLRMGLSGDPPFEVPDFEAEPALLEQPLWAALSAGLYWRTRGLNRWADQHDFVTLTRRINGGIGGLAERQALYSLAFGLLH